MSQDDKSYKVEKPKVKPESGKNLKVAAKKKRAAKFEIVEVDIEKGTEKVVLKKNYRPGIRYVERRVDA